MASRGLIRIVDRIPAPVAKGFRADSRLARIARPVLNRLVPDGQTVVTIRSGPGEGLKLPVKLKSEKFYWTGTHEQHVQDALAELLGPGKSYWDIGAHIGFLAVMAARKVGETGSVIAFEPMPDTSSRLKRSIELNEFANVTVLECAVADTEGERTLHPPKANPAAGSDVEASQPSLMWTLVDDLGDDAGVKVECRTLDGVAAEFGRPDLVKIDAEGAEVDVLEGGINLLKERDTKVIIEISDDETFARARALLPEHDFELLGANHWLIS